MIEWRLLTFAVTLMLAYQLRLGPWEQRHKAGTESPPLLILSSFLVFAVTITAMWLVWRVSGWATFLFADFFVIIPVDAAVAGIAVGFVLADQQVGGERALRHHSEELLRENRTKSAAEAGRIAALIAIFPNALSRATPTLPLAVLAILAVVPPPYWAGMMNRIQNLKAGVVELGLGPAAGDKVAQQLQDAAMPRTAFGMAGSADSHGFIQDRIVRMETLTHPSYFRQQSRVPDPSKPPKLAENPTAYLFTVTGEPQSGVTQSTVLDSSGIREVDRDRAFLLHLQFGGTARDTRGVVNGTLTTEPLPTRFEAAITTLGAKQAEVLELLASHVACIKRFVKHTGDRRLLQYRTTGVVEELYLFAELWSALERVRVLQLLRGPTTASDSQAEDFAKLRLLNQSGRLANALDRFASWSADFSGAWGHFRKPETYSVSPTVERRPPMVLAPSAQGFRSVGTGAELATGQPTDPIPQQGGGREYGMQRTACETYDYHHKVYARMLEMLTTTAPEKTIQLTLRRDDDFGKHGFTPYLTVFVAQALSALEDHAAALRLLTTWYDDLDSLVKDSQAIANPASDGSDRGHARRLLTLSAPWYRLTAFTNIIILQRLSASSENALPPTEEGLQHLVMTLYPDVLKIINQDPQLRDWRENSRQDCYAPNQSWRQPLLLSYAGWIKDYLDLRNRDFIRPSDVKTADLEFASLLGDLNLECFRDVLELDSERDEQRANFTMTEIGILMNELAQDAIDSRRRNTLHLVLEQKLNRTIDDLTRHARNAPAKSLTQRTVFNAGNPIAALLATAQRLKARLDTLPR